MYKIVIVPTNQPPLTIPLTIALSVEKPCKNKKFKNNPGFDNIETIDSLCMNAKKMFKNK